MKLEVGIKNSSLTVNIINDTSQTIRIWEQWNYWGWQTIYFIIKNAETNSEYIIKKNPGKDWTLNFPSFVEVPENNSFELTLNIHDGDWIIDTDLLQLKNVLLQIKAVLEIQSTPEAVQHGIFLGKVESDQITSQPPHKWLMRN